MPTAETLHRLLHACGFELIAQAGARELALPPPGDESDAFDLGNDVAAPEALPPDLPIETRARMLTAALEAAEAIVRAR